MGALNFLGDVATAYNGFNRGVADSQANNNAAEIQAAKMDSFRRQQALEGALRDIGSRIDQSDPNAPTTIPSLSGEMVPTGSQQDQMLADQLPPEDRPAITPQDVGQGALSRAQAMQQMGQAYMKNGDIDHSQRLFSAVQAMENEGDGAIAQGLLLGKDPNQLTAMYNSMGNNRLIPGTLKYDPTTQTATALNQDGSLWQMNPNTYNNLLGASKGLYAKIQSAQAETAAKNAEYQYKLNNPGPDKTPDRVAELNDLMQRGLSQDAAIATIYPPRNIAGESPEHELMVMAGRLMQANPAINYGDAYKQAAQMAATAHGRPIGGAAPNLMGATRTPQLPSQPAPTQPAASPISPMPNIPVPRTQAEANQLKAMAAQSKGNPVLVGQALNRALAAGGFQ